MNGLARSVRLLRAFRLEQREPERFYRVLADDSVDQVSGYAEVAGARVLDVGGGPGWFDEAFARAGAVYHAVERDQAELDVVRRRSTAATTPFRAVAADGAALPFDGGAFDVCFSSNVLEHVATPLAMLDEMVRVTRPAGTVVCAFTNWLSPWGGHETAPWHFLGGDLAARRYQRGHGHPPKNRYGQTLFPVHVGQVLRWARDHPGAELVDARPRYYPDWCRPIVHVPGLRELATWNLLVVLRRR